MNKWDKDIKNFINIFSKGKNIINISNSDLLMEYYKTKNVKENTTTNEWLIGIAEQKYPSYTIALKYIKEHRKHKGN